MSQFNLDPDRKITLGQSSPSDRNLPSQGKQKGKIVTNLQDINWTPQKLALTIAVLGIPYIGVVVACFIAEISLIAYFLIGIAVFFAIVVILLRLIDQQDF